MWENLINYQNKCADKELALLLKEEKRHKKRSNSSTSTHTCGELMAHLKWWFFFFIQLQAERLWNNLHSCVLLFAFVSQHEIILTASNLFLFLRMVCASRWKLNGKIYWHNSCSLTHSYWNNNNIYCIVCKKMKFLPGICMVFDWCWTGFWKKNGIFITATLKTLREF